METCRFKNKIYSQKVSNPNDHREEEKRFHFNWNHYTIKLIVESNVSLSFL